MIRKLLKISVFLVVLLVLAIVGVGMFADGLAKKGIEAGGSAALGVPTSVDGVSIGFFSGKVALEGLGIANPEAFGEGKFLELGTGAVEVSPLSLLSDRVEIPSLTLSKVRVNLVQGLKGSNYATILKHLEAFQGASEAKADEGKRFLIKKLTISDVLVNVSPMKELGVAEVKLPIDRIELTDVGSDGDKGVLLSELTGIVLEAVLTRASASGQLPSLVQGALGGQLAGLKGLANAKLSGIQGLLGGGQAGGKAGGLPTSAKDAKKALEKGLGGLLGK